MNPTKIIKGILSAVTIGAVLTACNILYTITYPTWTGDLNPNFEYVCEQIGVEYGQSYSEACRASPKPYIVVTHLLNERMRTWGFTFVTDELADMEPYIYVDPQAPAYDVVVQHEFAHWILRMIEIDDGSWDTCQHEKAARSLSDDGDVWDKYTAAAYGCEWKPCDEEID